MNEEQRRARRDIEKEGFWRGMLGEVEGSGLSVRAFCRERGLKEAQFYAWRRELRMRDVEQNTKPGFVELVGKGGKSGGAGVSIRIDDHICIQLERGFDETTLKNAVAAVTRRA